MLHQRQELPPNKEAAPHVVLLGWLERGPALAFAGVVALSVAAGCTEPKTSRQTASSDDGGRQALHFVDVTEEAGIDSSFDFDAASLEGFVATAPVPKNELPAMIGGAACADVDGDGWLDLLVLGGDNGAKLYLNLGDGTFSEVSESYGVVADAFASGPLFADLDGDGDDDLLLGGVGERKVQLLRNDSARFVDVTAESGLTQSLETVGFGIGDADSDGDLDVVAARWGQLYYPAENDPGLARQELFWVNDGSGHFTDQSELLRYPLRASRMTAAGELSEAALTPNFSDVDADGDSDLLLVQDFSVTTLMRNDTTPGEPIAFNDVSDRTVFNEDNGMGSAIGDIDNDGDLDWFVTSISSERSSAFAFHSGNRLYLNDGQGVFSDHTDAAGVRAGSWGWAACMADFDNDGWLDIFHVNGWGYAVDGIADHSPEFLDDAARLFLSNPEARGSFIDAAVTAGIDDRGQGRGVVCFDYDQDGDVDVFVTNSGSAARLYQNQLNTEDARYLVVQLRGSGVNRRGIGARVTVEADGATLTREVRVQNNYVSQDPSTVHFGLGRAKRVESLSIRWPSGESKTLVDVEANQHLVVEQ